MKRWYLFFVLASSAFFATAWADRVAWKGEVRANGDPTPNIKLTLEKKYRFKVSGSCDLGKWWQQGKPLANDACYEYHEELQPTKVLTFRNSLDVSVCDGTYHPHHIYQSKPFVAEQNAVHFWIYDVDYSNNNGALQVEVIELE